MPATYGAGSPGAPKSASSPDPATGYAGALVVAGLLPNSSLLTVAGWGHVSIGRSLCANQIISSYLVEQITPAPGTVCPQDVVPFVSGPSGP